MKRKRIIVIGFVVMLAVTSFASAFTLTETSYSDGFNRVSLSDNYLQVNSDSGVFETSTETFTEGNRSMKISDSGNSDDHLVELDRRFEEDNSTLTTTYFAIKDTDGTDWQFRLTDGTETITLLNAHSANNNDNRLIIAGTLVEAKDPDIKFLDGWNTFRTEIDYKQDKVRVYWNSSLYITTNLTSTSWNNESNMHVEYSVKASPIGGTSTVYWDNVSVQTAPVPVKSLSVDVDTAMQTGKSQDVTVTYTENGVSSDVTSETNITSHNTSLITVSNNTLTASNSNTGLVNVSFDYTNESLSENVTIFVGSFTIENIKNLPSNQWVPAILGIYDDQSTDYGLGSEIQWVLLAIMIGAMSTHIAKNEWLGLGIITALIILFWVNGSVSLGMTFVTVVYAIFAGYMLRETPSRFDSSDAIDINR